MPAKGDPKELHVYVEAVSGNVLGMVNRRHTVTFQAATGTFKTFYRGTKSVKVKKDANPKNKMPFFMIDPDNNGAEVYDMKNKADPTESPTYDPYANKPLTYSLLKSKTNVWWVVAARR